MIECNPNICFGQPSLKGRRLTVYDIVTKIYYEDSVDIALSEYDISSQDAKDAVAYCKALKCKEDLQLLHFCDGCLLRTLSEGNDFKKDDYIEVEQDGIKLVVSKDRKTFFAGSLQEFEDSEFGKVTWLIAEAVDKMW